MRHAQRMREGMAADRVAARSKRANHRAAKKSWPIDVCAGHEKMSAPAEPLEQVRDPHRARPAIVEGEEQGQSSGLKVGRVDRDRRPCRGGRDRAEVAIERFRLELV